MTEISTPQYFLRSAYTCDAIHPESKVAAFAVRKRVAHLSELGAGIGVVQDRTLTIDQVRRQVNEVVKIKLPLYQGRVEIHKNVTNVSVFGLSYVLSDADGMIEKIVQDDLNNLAVALDCIAVLDLWSVERAMAAARFLMESEVHQEAVERSPKHGMTRDDFEDISNGMARALTINYVAQMLQALYSLHKRTHQEFERFGWLLAAPIMILMLVLLMSAGHELLGLFAVVTVAVCVHQAIRLYTLNRFEKIGGYALRLLIQKGSVSLS
jgi:hypothetical protein